MRTHLLRFCAVAIAQLGCSQAQAQFAHSYKSAPVWSDEFNGSAVNRANWDFEEGFFGYNGELQTYQAGNTTVANGNLMITAKREWVAPYTNPGYTSSRLVSNRLQDFRFGKVEARIKLPLRKGMWPAFWMLGSDAAKWPLNGEIDIMEHVNADDQTHATEHYDDNGHRQYGTQRAIPAPVDGYHTYTTEWDAEYIRTYVDGQKYHEFRIAGGVGGTEEFQKRFFLLLNLAVGGEMTGYQSPNDNELPATMFVDYVRIFERADAPVVGAQGLQLEAENADLADMHVGKTLKAEACSEGGQSLGYIQAGNFLKFNVNFPTAGTYRLDYRVASGAAGGIISCDLNGGSIPLGNTTIPGTGGWQNWQTVSKKITIATAGTYDLGLFAQTAGYNLNWIRLTPQMPTSRLLEAESANMVQGMTAEACTEGGQDMGYVQAGGFLTFNNITFPTTGTYLVEYRVASGVGGGTISCDLNGGSIPLGNTTIPGTGGWQNWQTVSRTVSVNAGTYTFGVFAQTAGFNLNWIRISSTGAARPALAAVNTPPKAASHYTVFPNPISSSFSVAGLDQPGEVVVRSTTGRVWLRQHIDANESIDLQALPAGLYLVTIDTGKEQMTQKIVKE